MLLQAAQPLLAHSTGPRTRSQAHEQALAHLAAILQHLLLQVVQLLLARDVARVALAAPGTDLRAWVVPSKRGRLSVCGESACVMCLSAKQPLLLAGRACGARHGPAHVGGAKVPKECACLWSIFLTMFPCTYCFRLGPSWPYCVVCLSV